MKALTDFIYRCDHCGGATEFAKVYDQIGIGWWLEGLNGSGTNRLAVWCGACGVDKGNETND